MILCSGEALIDMLPRTTGDGAQAFAPHAGGAVFNTAIALGRLGVATSFFSGLSTDMFGDLLVDVLTQSGVHSDLVARSARPTTLAFVTLDDSGAASYAFYDENTAGRLLAPADLPKLGPEISTLFFGGISLAVTPCALAYEALLTQAGDRLVMIDPNIRPSFVADEAAYRARMARMIARADIVKVSDEDLHWLSGDGDLDDLAMALMATGPALIIVTRGADGARAYTADGAFDVAPHRAEVIDTVGAGDTFNAGVLAGLSDLGALSRSGLRSLDQDALRSALDLGARAAAVTVARAGANPPTRAELTQ